MNTKNFFPLLVFLISLPFSFLPAQESILIDRIYLQGGGFLQGQLLSQDSAGWSNFRLKSGETIRLQQSSITRIKRSNKPEVILANGKTVNSEGFYFTFHLGMLLGYSSGFDSRLVGGLEFFSLSFGHQFNSRLQIGGGVALDSYSPEFAPLFVEGRYYLASKTFSPYLALQSGYSLSFDLYDAFDSNRYGGGPLVHPAAGLRIAGKRRGNFVAEAGYRFQWGKNINPWATDKILYRRLALRFGWEF